MAYRTRHKVRTVVSLSFSISYTSSSDAGVFWGGKMRFSSVSWDISASSGHGREEILGQARASKTAVYEAIPNQGTHILVTTFIFFCTKPTHL
ncbi:Uncharacterised protein [Escherichia coli]|uniref:hypothetical protein n=1 Tax=Escherichia coli TaxID=562 RepID=UPI000DA45207|nr:hypothetical protein [Escherichia coli]SQM12275.1 Uncharacterised protein [Escherichia coli]SQM27238.1 Uncharacterised protein [Escherichia coli]